MPIEDWPSTVEEALAVQDRLRGRVELADDCPELPPTVTGGGECSASADAPETAEPAARTRAGCLERPGPLAFHSWSPVPTAPSRVPAGAGHRPSSPRCSGRPESGFSTPGAGESRDELGAHRSRDPEGNKPGHFSEGRPSRPTRAVTPRYRLLEAALRASRAALR
ncbi:hypothetical protein ACWED2_05475 [Amycolatopsis sp. NPDC005003]